MASSRNECRRVSLGSTEARTVASPCALGPHCIPRTLAKTRWIPFCFQKTDDRENKWQASTPSQASPATGVWV